MTTGAGSSAPAACWHSAPPMPIAMRSALWHLEEALGRRVGPDEPRFYVALDIGKQSAMIRVKDAFGLEDWKRRRWRFFSGSTPEERTPVILDVSEDLWAYAATVPWLDLHAHAWENPPWPQLAVYVDRPPRLFVSSERPSDSEMWVNCGGLPAGAHRFLGDTLVQYVDGRRTVVPDAWRSDEWCR